MNRMSLYSPSIERLIESFEKLPSIGHKTAARLAFYILNSTEEETNKFQTLILVQFVVILREMHLLYV